MPFDTLNSPERLAQDICDLRDPLTAAARFVGGPLGERRAIAALDALVTHGPASRFALARLRGLLRLLFLEDAPDFGAAFANIEPWDPRADEVMLLSDRLSDLIDALEQARLLEVA